MYDLKSLAKYNKCIIKEKEQTGKVRALSTCGENQQVCFLVEGSKLGVWTELSSLVGFEASKDQKAVLQEAAINEIKQEAEEDIHDFVLFVDNIFQKVKLKVITDIDVTNKFLAEQANIADAAARKLTKDTQTVATDFLNQTGNNIGGVVNKLTTTITEAWHPIWSKRILTAINIVDQESALKTVRMIQEENPKYSPEKVAKFLIEEKALFSMIFGFVADFPVPVPGFPFMVDLSMVTPLLSEMVYQIGACYGFEKLDKGEVLVIFSLSLGVNQSSLLGIGLLAKNIPVPTLIISPIANALIFLSVGYTACKYYEMRSQGAKNPVVDAAGFEQLKLMVEEYSEKLRTEIGATIDRIMNQAIAIKQEI